jgi:hypothetical protein
MLDERNPSTDGRGNDRHDLADEVAAWLKLDVPGEIERMIDAAQFSERSGVWNGGNIRVLPTEDSLATWPIAQPVSQTTPEQLRAIAAEHRQAAEELVEDADDLEHYADALEDRTPLGAAMLEHFGVMREEAEHRAAANQLETDIANGDGGVLAWAAIDSNVRWTLMRAGLLTVDDVRAAYETGRVWDVAGIGPVRVRMLADALHGEQS